MTGEAPRRSAASWLIVLFVFFAALYLSLPTAHHSYDAVAYAMGVQRAVITGSLEGLWHDYHILYEPLGYLLSAPVSSAGLHPLMVMQAANAVAGALLVTLLAAWLLARTGSRALALGGGLALGLSGSCWYYSTDAEPYVISTLGLLGLLAWLPLDGALAHLGRNLALAAVAFGLAVDFHASVVVLAPVVVLFLLVAGGAARGWRAAASFAGISGAIVVVAYLHKWLDVTRAGAGAGFGGMWRDTFAPENPVIGRYFLASSYDPVAEYAGLLHGFAPSTAAAGGWFQAALDVLPIGLTLVAVLGAWRSLRRRRWSDLFPFGCFVALLLFFASYNLADIKFTVFLAFFLIAAAVLSLADVSGAHPRVRPWLSLLPALALVLGVANYTRFIHPWSIDENNRDLTEATLIRRSTRPGDGVMLVGAGRRNGLKVYTPYFGEREPVILDFLFNATALPRDESLARVERRLEAIEARGGTVWVIADIVEKDGDALPFLQRNALAPQDLDALLLRRSVGPPVLWEGAPLIYPLRRAAVDP